MKMGRKKFRIATVILLIVCMIVLCMQNVKYGNMYNLADEEILADYIIQRFTHPPYLIIENSKRVCY